MIFPEFLSTTYNPKIACDFMNNDDETAIGDLDIVLKFKIPSNYPILAVDQAVNILNMFDREQLMIEGEDEILLPRNSGFRVISIKKNRCMGKHHKNVYLITLDTNCPQIKPSVMPKLNKKDQSYLNSLMK